MSSKWFMLTLVGRDQPAIVAKITTALYTAGCNFGEASMIRLGGNFSIMLMLRSGLPATDLRRELDPVTNALGLHCHIDEIEGQLHDHRIPDVRVSVYGADRAGIVSQITTVLTDAGMDISDLESDVAGSADEPVYIMTIEGHAARGIEELQQALNDNINDDIEVHLAPVDVFTG